nr:MAG TPA: hypothetical protein [Caudoviricetes sp.]
MSSLVIINYIINLIKENMRLFTNETPRWELEKLQQETLEKTIRIFKQKPEEPFASTCVTIAKEILSQSDTKITVSPNINAKLKEYFILLNNQLDSFSSETKIINQLYCKSFGERIYGILKEIRNILTNIGIYDTTCYYNKKIEESNSEKDTLAKEIQRLKNKLSKETGESECIRSELRQKKEELENSIALIKQYQSEKAANEKINNSINIWNGKITTSFLYLRNCISPIKNEYKRLKILYYIYGCLSILCILGLFYFEFVICHKIQNSIGLITFEQYLSTILPVPIAIGLLWGFIHEMNRSQRQMVILAKEIHEIEYIEGLLLTINSLSINIEESTKKVNIAIERLLNIHLNYNSKKLANESELKKEEEKDTIPYSTVINILKEANVLTRK